jgi:hypothetical protein
MDNERSLTGKYKYCRSLITACRYCQWLGASVSGAHSRGGCRIVAPPQTPQNQNLKDTDFVDMIISKVLRDFPFSRNQPLKSADDQYIRILKNKLTKLKNKKTGHCD